MDKHTMKHPERQMIMRSYGNPKKNLLQLTRIFTIDILNIGAPADIERTKRFQFRVHVFN